ncbi:hypothetical protein LCGC14_1434070, partial [marine sediment metagenome]
MPLQYRQWGTNTAQPQPDYFGQMMGKVGERDKQQRVQQAMEFLQTGKVTENRSYIQKSLSGSKSLISSQQEAMNVLRKEVPDIYKEIVTNERRIKDKAEKLEVDKKKWLVDNAVPGISRALDQIAEIPEDDLELRASVGNQLSQLIFSTAPKQYGFGEQEPMTEKQVSDKGLKEMRGALETLGAEPPT